MSFGRIAETGACLLVAGFAIAGDSPELLFKSDFDGTTRATIAKGVPDASADVSKCVFVPGLHGNALRLSRENEFALSYEATGNLCPERGAVAFWFKPLPCSVVNPGVRTFRYFFCTEANENRHGTGELWFWRVGRRLRADVGDDGDNHIESMGMSLKDGWNYIVFNWSETGMAVYLNGRSVARPPWGAAKLFEAAERKFPLRPTEPSGRFRFGRRKIPSCFYVGNKQGSDMADGDIDDFEIWSAPLPEEEIRRRVADGGNCGQGNSAIHSAKMTADNPHLAQPFGCGGVIPDLELVESVKFDSIPADTNRFCARGSVRIGELDGVHYLEAGRAAQDRWVYRFILPDDSPLYCFEIDYPDDCKRTMDVVVQGTQETRWDNTPGADYCLHAGVACGDEYPNSGRILTDRYLYWRRGRDVTLSTMTCRGGAPAAIAAVRVYRVKSGRLPVADIHEPPANKDGWHRTFACYYEDVSVGYNFAVDGDGGDLKSIGPMLDRLVATMKFTGQNVLCYPGSWYGGLMGEGYLPRSHVAEYRSVYLDRFDREGLFYLPTINQYALQLSVEEVLRAPGGDGTCHDSPLAIFSDGSIARGTRWRMTSFYNILHPRVQTEIMKSVETFIAEGRSHPSFKGVLFHLTQDSILWFSSEKNGYNDYAVRAFARERNVPVPMGGDDPMRGRMYADWIREHAFGEWIDWRCEKLAEFYRRIAARLSDARSDLKLVINSFLRPNIRQPDFTAENFIEVANRRGGLDARKLADVPNISICQSEMPADYRWMSPRDPDDPKDCGRWGEMKDVASCVYRTLYLKAGDYGSISYCAYPWVNQHDRYWEDHIAATKEVNCHGLYYHDDRHGPLPATWLKECPWRVPTLNPSGRDALRAYAVPMRFTDVLAHSKGGFVIGTYGTEDVLVPWMRAFRALPAVKMEDCGGDEFVKVRAVDFCGRKYLYVLNTLDEVRTVSVGFASRMVDCVTGELVDGTRFYDLQPYELRSYVSR